MLCPVCGNDDCRADWVDIGVGGARCGPYACEVCGWVQSREPDDMPVTLPAPDNPEES
jgi:rubredoxin